MVKRRKNSKIRVSSNAIAIIGALIIILGLFLISYNFINKKRMVVYDYINEQINTKTEVRSVTPRENEKTEGEETEPSDIELYAGYLEIPKINFNRGFYQVDSSQNTVESNIEVIRGSSMPNQKAGNLIIAGHSGTGWKAFFNDLYQLSINDQAIVIYKDQKYTYKIVNIYEQAKTGKITIRRNKNKTTLTLITCTNNNNTTQTIYVAELESVE